MEIRNALIVDVEDYFHVSTFAKSIYRASWGNYPLRVEINTQRLLDSRASLLEAHCGGGCRYYLRSLPQRCYVVGENRQLLEVPDLFELAKDSRLKVASAAELCEARAQYKASGDAAHVFKGFRYQIRTSWSCERRVIGKAEHLPKGENPRFVVTSLSAERMVARTVHCPRSCWARNSCSTRSALLSHVRRLSAIVWRALLPSLSRSSALEISFSNAAHS